MVTFTKEEWDILTYAAALQLAQEQIIGTDKTLPVKIEALRAAKEAEIERLVQSATEAGVTIDASKDVERIIDEAQRAIDGGLAPPGCVPSDYVNELRRRTVKALTDRLYEALPEIKRLREEGALLEIARDAARRNYDQILKDKPRPYIALHALLTLSRTFRAAAFARWSELLSGEPAFSATVRARAEEVLEERLRC